ncbi:MAG TPA: CaiB/BaiF CoA-transferase family protein [Candidatus Limnocylindrales bacterium]|nr:CaiB/BaiF CoA-transferase family protein [Candidatus Limnocylindrales bacterium]
MQGVRVLDLTRLLPGGYATMLMARMGADVVKVEAPGHGDPLRALPGGAAYFAALHAGKRSVALRLKSEAGRRALLKLAERSDALIEGFRPGVMDRLGLGFEVLRRANPRLVYCAITGYGSTGPLRARAGHDLNYLARAGVLSLMPPSGRAPAIPAVQLADLAGGMQAIILVLAALLERERTGRGRRVEVAMTDVARSWLTTQRAVFQAGEPGIPLTGELPCYHVYPTRDGFLTVAALEAPFWQAFCDAIDRPDLCGRQLDPTAIDEVAGVLERRTRAEWMARFGDKDVCVEPVLSLGEAEPDPGAGVALAPAPALGQHTREVLAESGLSLAEIDALA